MKSKGRKEGHEQTHTLTTHKTSLQAASTDLCLCADLTSIIRKTPALTGPSWLISANCQLLVKGKNQGNPSTESVNLSNATSWHGVLGFSQTSDVSLWTRLFSCVWTLTRCFAFVRSSSLDILSRRIALVNCSLARALSRSSSLLCFSLERQERSNLEGKHFISWQYFLINI